VRFARRNDGGDRPVTEAPQPCDLLIEAGWVVPVVPHGVVLEDHAVAVRDGAIVAILPWHEARAAFDPRELASRPGSALIPGRSARTPATR